MLGFVRFIDSKKIMLAYLSEKSFIWWKSYARKITDWLKVTIFNMPEIIVYAWPSKMTCSISTTKKMSFIIRSLRTWATNKGSSLNALFRFHQMREVKKHSKPIYSLVIIKKENARVREGLSYSKSLSSSKILSDHFER